MRMKTGEIVCWVCSKIMSMQGSKFDCWNFRHNPPREIPAWRCWSCVLKAEERVKREQRDVRNAKIKKTCKKVFEWLLSSGQFVFVVMGTYWLCKVVLVDAAWEQVRNFVGPLIKTAVYPIILLYWGFLCGKILKALK